MFANLYCRECGNIVRRDVLPAQIRGNRVICLSCHGNALVIQINIPRPAGVNDFDFEGIESNVIMSIGNAFLGGGIYTVGGTPAVLPPAIPCDVTLNPAGGLNVAFPGGIPAPVLFPLAPPVMAPPLPVVPVPPPVVPAAGLGGLPPPALPRAREVRPLPPGNPDNCGICLDGTDPKVITNCNHIFHDDCLSTWQTPAIVLPYIERALRAQLGRPIQPQDILEALINRTIPDVAVSGFNTCPSCRHVLFPKLLG